MQLNEAISKRLVGLLNEKNLTQYQLYLKSGVLRSTINNVVNCTYPTMKIHILHELCQGLDISLKEFFDSPLFNEENLDP